MGSASVIGNESARWAAAEGVEEHAKGEREQSLGDPLHETGGCLGEVLLEAHLALEVGDRRLHDEPQAGEPFLALEVVGAADAVGSEDGDLLQRERLGVLAAPQTLVGDQRAPGLARSDLLPSGVDTSGRDFP